MSAARETIHDELIDARAEVARLSSELEARREEDERMRGAIAALRSEMLGFRRRASEWHDWMVMRIDALRQPREEGEE